jgi:hypothetical protein
MPNARRNFAVQLVADGDNPFKVTLYRDTSLMPIRIGQAIAAGLLTLVAQGGVAPYAFSIPTGSLPAGLSLDSTTGNITGTPTTYGHNEFVAEGQDSSSPDLIYDGTFDIFIDHVLQTVDGTPTPGEINVLYSYQFNVSGNTGAVTYAVTSGALPHGLSLSTGGNLSGLPDDLIGVKTVYPFTVTATDAGTGDALPIQCQLIIWPSFGGAETTIVQAYANTQFSNTLSIFFPQDGFKPYSYSVDGWTSTIAGDAAGVQPMWLSFDLATLTLSGTPPSAGDVGFELRVTDQAGGVLALGVDIKVSFPNQQMGVGADAVFITDPNRISLTNDDGSMVIIATDDGSGGVEYILRAEGTMPTSGGIVPVDSGGVTPSSITYHRDGSYGSWGQNPTPSTDTINLSAMPIGDSLKIFVDGVETFPVFTGLSGYFGVIFTGSEVIECEYLCQPPVSDSTFSASGIGPADPYFSFVQNLFPMSEANGAQTITDVITSQAWTFGGTVAVNSGYLVCDGSGGSSSHAITVGPQTGTPVVWVHEFFGVASSSSAPGYAMFCFNSGRGLFYQTQSLQYYQSGQLGITGAITLNSRTHFALFYDLTNWYLARNGIVEATFTAPEQYFEFFGIAEDFSGGTDYLNQFKLGPIRTTVGSLRGYSSAGFTPPTDFPDH